MTDPLMNLADALVEDVLAMSDEEIMEEVSEEELAEAYRARERALESAHNGGLSDFGLHVLGFDKEPTCKNETSDVRADGGCLKCNADAGEACRSDGEQAKEHPNG